MEFQFATEHTPCQCWSCCWARLFRMLRDLNEEYDYPSAEELEEIERQLTKKEPIQ